MSDLYRPTGRFKGEIKRLVVQGALVPAEPDYEAAMVEFKKFWDRPFATPEGDEMVLRKVVAAALGAGIGGDDG